MKVGLLGGSFNPVHQGHVALARELVAMGYVEEVWLVLSPLNPLKEHPEALIADEQRLEMLRLATGNVPGVKVCDIELQLPRPSYTIRTLRELQQQFPEHEFHVVIGADNWAIFPQWRDYPTILREFAPLVYPRPGYPAEGCLKGLPQCDISSSRLRHDIAQGNLAAVEPWLNPNVFNYITSHSLYGYDQQRTGADGALQ